MANRQRGEMTLKAGKKTYTLALGTEAVCEFEDFSDAQSANGVGRTWEQVLSGINRGRIKDVRLFFWVALRTHHPDIATMDPTSLKAVSAMMDTVGMTPLSRVLIKLLAINSEGTDKGSGDEDPAEGETTRPLTAQAGTGDSSTPTH